MFVVMVALSGCSPRNEPARRTDGSVPTNGATAVERPAEAPALAPGGEGGAAHVPFRARGNEPGWSLEIGDRDMRLLADYGDLQLAGPAPAPVTAGDTTRYSARPQGHLIEVTVVHRLCHDGMSGFPYPSIVTVRLDGRELHGCGGERLDADSSAAPPAR
jgi:uncharacterized membrane protein